MADRQISALPQVGSIAEDAMFVLEQDGTAYHATASQMKAMMPAGGGGSGSPEGAVRYDAAQSLSAAEMARARANIGAAAVGESGGTGGGESVLLIDLAETVQVDSGIDDIPNRAQTFEVAVDNAAVLAHTGRIDITYTDSRFPEEIQRATFTNRRTDPTASGNQEALVLFASPVNPWDEDTAMLCLKLRADGTAGFLYRAHAAEQADMAEDDETVGSYIKNNPIKFKGGYTIVENEPRPSKIQYGENSVTVTLEDGSSGTLSFTKDSSGNITTIKYPDGHTVEVS